MKLNLGLWLGLSLFEWTIYYYSPYGRAYCSVCRVWKRFAFCLKGDLEKKRTKVSDKWESLDWAG